MIEDKATEKLKKRLKDMGLIVNMGADKAQPKPTGTEKRATSHTSQKRSNNDSSRKKKRG